jgi:hypothetical protein
MEKNKNITEEGRMIKREAKEVWQEGRKKEKEEVTRTTGEREEKPERKIKPVEWTREGRRRELLEGTRDKC